MRRLLLSTLALVPACVPSYEFAGQGADASNDAAIEAPAHDAPPPDTPPLPGVDATPPTDAAGSDAPPPFVSLQDCVLLMHFDEPSWSGAGSVKDSSTTGNDGTPVGTVNPTANGKFGGALDLGGAGYVDIPDSASLHPTSALTLSAWIYPTALAMPPDAAQAYPGIVSKRADFNVNVEYTMFLWYGDNLWGDTQGTSQQYRFNGLFTFANSTWYHVAIVTDGTQSKTSLYVNGALDGPALPADPLFGAAPAPPPDLLIGYLNQGTRNPDSQAYFIGRIDEVAIWTRALSATEVLALAQATGPL